MVSPFRMKKSSSSGGLGLGRVLAEFDRSSITLRGCLVESPDKKDDSSNHSLTSTNSSSSIDSNLSSTKASRKVQFYPKVTVYPCRETLITVEDRKRRWITKYDLESIKDNIRATANSVLEHSELRTAMDRLHTLIRKQNFYVAVDVDDDSYSFEDSVMEDEPISVCSGMCELDLARILIDSETRGVERMIFARLDQFKGELRPVTRHSRVVLETQASVRQRTPDERAAAIAQQCKTGASSKWAHTLGRSDAEAVARDFMLQM